MRTKTVDFGFCYKCGNKVNDEDYGDTFQCQEILENGEKCNCTSIVLSSNFLRKDDNGGIVCTCLNEEFDKPMHMDFRNYCKDVYQCTKCKNCITIDTFREMF